MSLNKPGMEDMRYLQQPENSKRFARVKQLVQVLLVITITAVIVMAIHLYSTIK